MDISQRIVNMLIGTDIEKMGGDSAEGIADLSQGVVQAGHVLPAMFTVVNGFALIATAIAVLYIISVGVLHTAHEGKTLGQKYSTLWTPIRSALGVTFVAPAPFLGGFSIMQAIIIGMVLISIQGANVLWKTTVEFFVDESSLLVKPPYQSISPSHFAFIVQNQMCLQHQNEEVLNTRSGQIAMRQMNEAREASSRARGSSIIGSNWLADSHERSVQSNLNRIPHLKSEIEEQNHALIWHPHCGQMAIDCGTGDSQSERYCRAIHGVSQDYAMTIQGTTVPALIEYFRNPDPDATLSIPSFNFSDLGASGTASDAGSTIHDLIAVGQEANANLYRTIYVDDPAAATELQEEMEKWKAYAIEQGWLSAGQWHYFIHVLSHRNSHGMNSTPTYREMDTDKLLNYEDELAGMMMRLRDLYSQSNQVFYDADGNLLDLHYEPINESDSALQVANKLIGPTMFTMVSILKPDGNPIGQLANLGHYMVNSSMGVIGASILLKGGADASQQSILGKISVVGVIAGSIINSVIMLVLFLVGPLLLAGAFLAYYLPMIPFIFWMFGVIGWMIMICESMVAAPLWAASHALPEGEGFAGRYAAQGYQLFLNVLFRPILLLLGLVLSMQVMYLISYVALQGFIVANSITVSAHAVFANTLPFIGSISQLFGHMFGNLILVTLMITLSHKAHEMIYETADNVMRWIGFGTRPLGEAQGEAATNRVYAGAAMYSRDASGAMIAKGGQAAPNPTSPGGGGNKGGAQPSGGKNPASSSANRDVTSGGTQQQASPARDNGNKKT